MFDGRVQATLGTVSDLVFSIDAQNDLVRDLEVRTIGVSRALSGPADPGQPGVIRPMVHSAR